ncbi:hypothetical protein [Asanoa sp. NPDC050611]|uniref:hypothetical protein n=1 Tax=Asanoa sp. NPDC050611 TaxID=3157098 RepID=UPI0033C71CC2
MTRRIVAVLAALAVGAVLLRSLGEVLFYGLEGFPVEADAKGVIRILSATGAVLALLVGAVVGARVPGPARGWPLVAAGLVVAGLLSTYAPLDADSAFNELHPLVRPIAALAGGVAIGAAAVAVLPGVAGEGDPWPVAALAAGIIAGIPATVFLPAFPDPRYHLGWADVAAVVLAVAAALVAPASTAGPARPAVRTFTLVALVGVLVSAGFHMEYVGRSTVDAPAAVVVLVLLLTIAVWVLLTGALARWSDRAAGPDAARFGLTVAGAGGVLFTASGRNLGIAWGGFWLPLLAVAAAVAGALLTRRRPAVPWDAYGVAAAAAVATVVVTTSVEHVGYVAVGAPVSAFALGAALARTSTAGALCGLLAAAVTLPVLVGTVTQLNRLVADDDSGDPILLYAPIWLSALFTAALLARRRRTTPAPLAVG